jgi:hypothetical protein
MTMRDKTHKTQALAQQNIQPGSNSRLHDAARA